MECDKVKGYYIPHLSEEVITNNAFVNLSAPGLCLWPIQKLACTTQSDGQMGENLSPPAFPCFISKSFLLFFFFKGVGKCLSKEQRKGEWVVRGDEIKRKEEVGLGKSCGEAQFCKKK